MNSINRYGLKLFGLVLVMHLLSIYFEMERFRFVTKLLLLPMLIIYLVAYTKINSQKSSALVYAGLVFSFLGDLILSQTGEMMFLAGMLAFIGTHICNSLFFYRLQKGSKAGSMPVWIAFFILCAVSISMFYLLSPYLGSFQLPILIYMGIISIMAILAVATVRNPLLAMVSKNCFIPGAFLFVISDGCLALNKFLLHQRVMDVFVMFTYGAAQYFLVKGFGMSASKNKIHS